MRARQEAAASWTQWWQRLGTPWNEDSRSSCGPSMPVPVVQMLHASVSYWRV